MSRERMRVLVLSELFPNPARPALGIFVQRQVHHLKPYCDQVVVVPTRVFPHLRLWQDIVRPGRFLAGWRAWRNQVRSIPAHDEIDGIRVFYPRYTSPPRQIFHGLWGFFAYLSVRSRLRKLHEELPFDLIHAHYASPCGIIALMARRWMKVPIVLSVHGADITYTGRQNPIGAAVVRRVFRDVDAVFANSRWTQTGIARYGIDRHKVRIVRLGGNTDRPIGSGPAPSRQGFTLVTVGHLEDRKGHAYVFRAVRRLLDEGYRVRHIVVGDGPQADQYRTLAHRLGLSDVITFAGHQPHDAVWPYLDQADIFVLPSWNEAFGVAYVEALFAGKPVIGCEGEGGPEDLSALGDCIVLVKPRDVDSLTGAIRSLLNDGERRSRMGVAGRRIVQDHYTWERNASETMTVYRDAVGVRCA